MFRNFYTRFTSYSWLSQHSLRKNVIFGLKITKPAIIIQIIFKRFRYTIKENITSFNMMWSSYYVETKHYARMRSLTKRDI